MDHMDSGRAPADFKISHTETKAAKQQRMNMAIHMQNSQDSYMLESPELNNRRVNNKAGVQLAPLNPP